MRVKGLQTCPRGRLRRNDAGTGGLFAGMTPGREGRAARLA